MTSQFDLTWFYDAMCLTRFSNSGILDPENFDEKSVFVQKR